MNMLDLGIIVIIALCALMGYKRGLIRTVYRLVSFFIAIFLANLFYPYVARFLRGTNLFTGIQNRVQAQLGLGDFVTEHAANRQTEIIDSLPLPASLRDFLQTRFNPDIHGLLRVDTVEEYISAFFADIAINGIALFVVFLMVLFALSIIGGFLDIVGRLPIIRTFNNLGGLVVGIALGVGIAWLGLAVMSMLFVGGANSDVYEMVQGSLFATLFPEFVLPRLW